PRQKRRRGRDARTRGGVMGPCRELPASFLYEPSAPPTIAPGMTIADYRRQRGHRRKRRRWSRRRR
ncbi:MAG: hypothetical protein ACREX8_07695, partial [Gammaproteobacteria bacterium]